MNRHLRSFARLLLVLFFIGIGGAEVHAGESTGQRKLAPRRSVPDGAQRGELTLSKLRSAVIPSAGGSGGGGKIPPRGAPAAGMDDAPKAGAGAGAGAGAAPVVGVAIRRTYGSLLDQIHARLEAKNPLVMDEQTFAKHKEKLDRFKASAAASPTPAPAATGVRSAKVSFDGQLATVELTAPSRSEIIRVELPPDGVATSSQRATLETALKSLPEALALHQDRIEKIIFSEGNYVAVIDGKPFPIIPPEQTERLFRDEDVKLAIAMK
jgi:hypothetical protein